MKDTHGAIRLGDGEVVRTEAGARAFFNSKAIKWAMYLKSEELRRELRELSAKTRECQARLFRIGSVLEEGLALEGDSVTLPWEVRQLQSKIYERTLNGY